MEAVAGVRGRTQCRILNVEYIVTGHTACGGCGGVVCGTVEAVAGARGRALWDIGRGIHCDGAPSVLRLAGKNREVCGRLGWGGQMRQQVNGWFGLDLI